MVLVIKTPITTNELTPIKEQVISNTEAISKNTVDITVLEEEVDSNTEAIASNTTNLVTLDAVITELESSLVNTIREVKLTSNSTTITLDSTTENTTIIINNSLEEVYGDFSKNTFVNYNVITGEFTLIGSGVVTFKLNYLLDKTSGATGEVTVNIYLKREEAITLVGSKVINVTPAGLSEDLSYNFSYQDGDIVYLTYQTDVANIILAASGLVPAVDLRITQIVGGADLSNYPTKVQTDDKYLSKETFRTLLKTQVGEIVINVDPSKKDITLWSDGLFEYGLCDGQGIDVEAYPELAAIYGSSMPNFMNGVARHLEKGSTRSLGDFQDYATENFSWSFEIAQNLNADGTYGTSCLNLTNEGISTTNRNYSLYPSQTTKNVKINTGMEDRPYYQRVEYEHKNNFTYDHDTSTYFYPKVDLETRMANIAVQYYVKARVVY